MALALGPHRYLRSPDYTSCDNYSCIAGLIPNNGHGCLSAGKARWLRIDTFRHATSVELTLWRANAPNTPAIWIRKARARGSSHQLWRVRLPRITRRVVARIGITYERHPQEGYFPGIAQRC